MCEVVDVPVYSVYYEYEFRNNKSHFEYEMFIHICDLHQLHMK